MIHRSENIPQCGKASVKQHGKAQVWEGHLISPERATLMPKAVNRQTLF